MLKFPFLSIAMIVSSASFADAQTLKPMQAKDIDLGTAHGSAYYIAEPKGYRVIATLDTGSASPIRFDTILVSGQSATVSIPAGPGETAIQVTFVRHSDHMDVVTAGVASDLVTASTR